MNKQIQPLFLQEAATFRKSLQEIFPFIGYVNVIVTGYGNGFLQALSVEDAIELRETLHSLNIEFEEKAAGYDDKQEITFKIDGVRYYFKYEPLPKDKKARLEAKIQKLQEELNEIEGEENEHSRS